MIRKNNKKGFSLVELLVVITIIAILSVVAYTALGGQTAKARNSKRAQDLGTVQSTLEIYFIENANKYPDNLSDLVPKYMPKIPTDPSSATQEYSYAHDSSFKKYQLGATQETEDTPSFVKAYVIGNGDSLLTNSVKYDHSATCTATDQSPTCIPYFLP